MNAFIRTDHGLFKVYRHGDDWQVVGPNFERWFSVWKADPVASLYRALDSVPGVVLLTGIVSLED